MPFVATQGVEPVHLMKYQHRQITVTIRCVVIAIGAALCLAPYRARADEIIAYNFYASESLSVVLAKAALDTAVANNPPNSPAVISAQNKLALAKSNAGKATPFQLAVARNTPFILLENMSTSASLEDFTLTINDPTQTFAKATVIPSASAEIPDVVTPNGSPNPALNLNFPLASRLAPGEFVVIQVNLDPVDSSGDAFADYRDLFFKLNSSDTDGNATTKASFFDPNSNSTVDLPDFEWANQDYPSEFGNPIIGLKFPSKPHGDHVTGFSTGDGISVPVPEPSAMVLGSLGALSLLIFRRLKRGQRAGI